MEKEIFAGYNVNIRPKAEQMENFNRSVDDYLRGAAEELAKDFGLEETNWPQMDKNFIQNHGGLNRLKLINFNYYTMVRFKEDTEYLITVFQQHPNIFLSRAINQHENTFRFTLELWLDAVDTLNNAHQDPWSLRLFWNHFQPCVNYFIH